MKSVILPLFIGIVMGINNKELLIVFEEHPIVSWYLLSVATISFVMHVILMASKIRRVWTRKIKYKIKTV